MPLSDAEPKVYSYLRFSRPEQSEGDSEDRQLRAVEAFAERKGLQLDKKLSLADRGLSGFHGTNRKKGALGAFLKLVEAGEIAPGSILVVENIDRLSREGVISTLRQIIFQLFDHGITLQTLSPEESYEPGCDSNPKFIALFLYMSRAHDESSQKSMRLREAWKKKRLVARDEGKLLTRMVPAWLEVTKKETFAVKPSAAATIRAIFEMKREGVGAESIAKRLNSGCHWQPPLNEKRKSSGWRPSYIQKILRDRSVLGEYQPHRKVDGKRIVDGEPIADYFPPVIPAPVFAAVQEQIRGNRGKGGQTGKVSNLLTHLVFCAYCGEPMHFVDKGRPPKGAQYLRCANEYTGRGCRHGSFRYDEIEELILQNCAKLDPRVVLPNPDAQTKRCKALRERATALEAQQAEAERKLNNLADQIADTASKAVRTRLDGRMVALEQTKVEVAAAIGELHVDLRQAEVDLTALQNWQAGLSELRSAMQGDAPEIRLRLRQHLKEFILRIDCYVSGHAMLYDPATRDGESIAEYIDDVLAETRQDESQYTDFKTHTTARRMSRQGRFIRVHFKSKAVVNLVPPGSIADGLRLAEDRKWEFVRPDIDSLWRKYLKRFPIRL